VVLKACIYIFIVCFNQTTVYVTLVENNKHTSLFYFVRLVFALEFAQLAVKTIDSKLKSG